MTDVSLDGILLSDAVPEAVVKRVNRQLLGDRRDVYEIVPGHAGSWVFGEQPGDRIITLELALVGEASTYPVEETALESRRAACRALADWADSDQAVKLIVDDEPDRYSLAKLSSTPAPDEWLRRALLSLDFRASPYAFATELSTESLTGGGSYTFDIDDRVNAYPVIEIHALDDIAGGFTLTVNGLDLVRTTPLANDDRLTISSLSYTVSTGANTDTELDGIFVVDDLAMSDIDGDFPILVPGTNELNFSGGPTEITVTWRRRYR